jgi:hypothetical protein
MDELITSSGISLDMAKGVPVPLNLAIADFREPDKRQRNFSKEIELPGTLANQKYFSSAFSLTQIGGAFDFNSSAKVNCTYYKNGIAILRNAVLKLNSVTILDEQITFKVGIYSDFVDVFLILSTIDVGDLDWSAYTHTLTNANIQASWSSPIGQGYYYPLIERNQRLGVSKWKNTDMVPYVHLVEVFKKCMDFVGQQYDSNFLNTTRAKSILFGYGGGGYVDAAISPIEQNNRKVLLNNGAMDFAQDIFVDQQFDNNGSPIPLANQTILFNSFSLSAPSINTGSPAIVFNEVQDIYNQFAPNTFTAQRTGLYKMTLTGSIGQLFSGQYDYVTGSGGDTTIYYLKNGVPFPLVNLVQTAADQTFALNLVVNLSLNQGDEISFEFGAAILYAGNPVINSTISRKINTPVPLQLSFVSMDTTLVEGSVVEIGRFLPSMKCSDFVLGFIRMFKLMITDPDIYDTVRIEPEASFYQGTNIFTDITEEVDLSKEIEIRPSANEYAKKLTYIFKAGTETDYKNYFQKWEKGYGDLSFDQASFFAKGEQKIEIPFGTIVPYEVYPGMIIPRFVDIDNQGNRKVTSGVPRIMYRNGLKPGIWQLVGSTINEFLTYPSVHHFDNWQNPTYDLNFELVNEVYYATNVVTTVNTYSEYYAASVNEIISKEGKYVTLYRKMDNLQVEKLDWSKLLMWNGALFRFNKILDFDSEVTEVTKIEIIKVLEAKSFNRKQITTAKKLPSIYGAVKLSPIGNVGTGAPVLNGGEKNQTLEISKIMIG